MPVSTEYIYRQTLPLSAVNEQVSYSDHCLVPVTVGEVKQRRAKFNYEIWKFNIEPQQDENFLELLKENKSLEDAREHNIIEKLERFKQHVKMVAIERSTEMKFQAKKEESELKEILSRLTVEANEPGTFMSDIRNIKAKIEAIETEKYKGALIRAREENYTAGEMPTKRALADEKRYAKKNDISQIGFNGAVTEEQREIQLAFFQHYQDLFSYKKPQTGFDSLFLTQLPHLESEVTERL